MKVIGIYLAAGKSTRMGRNKLELPFIKGYLGTVAFREALESKLDITFAITRKGDQLRFLAPFSKRMGWCYFRCLDENSGLSESLKTGVSKATEWGADAVVVLLADQPFVTTECINRLLEEFILSPNLLFVSALQNGILKPPVLLSKALFPALKKLKGEEGAKWLLQSEWREQGKGVEFEDSIFIDVDTLDEYESMLDQLRSDGIGCDR
jgi:molybdenum cofactor cytidylyltransferase